MKGRMNSKTNLKACNSRAISDSYVLIRNKGHKWLPNYRSMRHVAKGRLRNLDLLYLVIHRIVKFLQKIF